MPDPDPTLSSVAASTGPFATTQVSVPAGHGFNGGMIYHPTDTSLGTWGAVAIVPGYTALFANEEAWMGPWLASFGFVVIGKGAVALAPFSPSQTMAGDTVPTMVMGGQNDTVVTPSYLAGLYATLPASTQSDFIQIARRRSNKGTSNGTKVIIYPCNGQPNQQWTLT